jgi:hypothetical protein
MENGKNDKDILFHRLSRPKYPKGGNLVLLVCSVFFSDLLPLAFF